MHYVSLLFSTVVFRPYVFIFLAIYLIAAAYKVGVRKAVVFTLTAWAIAYAAEFSSIRNGIPFGRYYYIPSTVNCELWICGVPFMDSLSFTFLAYSSWATARVFMCPADGKWFNFALRENTSNPPLSPLSLSGEGKRYVDRFSIGTVFLGALLFMLIDVVIDPLSLRGDKWFLGKIYYYPNGGAYFGVTITNFIGWFIVGFVTLSIWGVIDKRLPDRGNPFASVDLLGPLLYMIVLLFNLTMTFYIGETTIGWVGVFIFLPVVFLMAQKVRGSA